MTRSQQAITHACDEFKAFLLKKNQDYGDAAFNPLNIFAKTTAKEQLKVRIDDKLSRILTGGKKNFKEDTLKDLAGYYLLLTALKFYNSH